MNRFLCMLETGLGFMGDLLLDVLNMSITAGWMILGVLLLRLLLKKAPKWIPCLLWGLVALRLLCPFSLESGVSLIPSRETIPADIALQASPAIHSGISALDNSVNPIISQTLGAGTPVASANPLQILIPFGALVWLIGILLLPGYGLFTYFRLKKTVSSSLPLGDNVFACDEVKAPFILGLFRPRIYLPSSLEGETREFVLRHERAHLRRRDHIWKPLGYLLLAVHWFNPLCWLAYALLCRDIEMACDERVIRELDRARLADYSQALLNLSIPKRRIAVCPLAFGEVGVKGRVKEILHYKKPALWILLAAVLVCGAFAVCLLTDPLPENRPGTTTGSGARVTGQALPEGLDTVLTQAIIERNQAWGVFGFATAAYDVLGVSESGETISVYAWTLYMEYSYDGRELIPKMGSHVPAAITFQGISDEAGGVRYELTEYWEPRDGSLLAKDIRARFPASLVAGAFDHSGTEARSARCLEAARAHFGLAGMQEWRAALQENYPEFFDLPTEKGLEVYVWQMAEGVFSCGLLPGANKEKDLEELWNMKGASLNEMRLILSTYDIDEKDVDIIIWQNPISSYIAEYWIIRQDEDPVLTASRRQAYIESIRQSLFGG